MANLGTIVHSTIAIISKALHDGMLFFVEGNILAPIPCLSLIIIMVVLQLTFCICSLPGCMIRAKKMLVDVKEHSLTVLHGSSLFHIDKFIHVNKYLGEYLIHHCVVNLECISLVVNIDPIQ